jgi:hypothetical protein
MVMGFNTKITHKGVTYHVQTEPRRNMRVETTVYLRGAIIHSQMTSWLEPPGPLGHREAMFHQKLEEQHRQVIEKIRSGEICSSPPPPGEA